MGERHLDKEVAEGAENETVEQLAFADKVLLNKCDLVMAAASGGAGVAVVEEDCAVAPEEGEVGAGFLAKPDAEIKNGEEHLANLEARIKKINKTAEIIRTSYSRVDPKRLLGMNAFSLERVLEMDPGFLEADGADHVHDDSVSSVAWKFPGLELDRAHHPTGVGTGSLPLQ